MKNVKELIDVGLKSDVIKNLDFAFKGVSDWTEYDNPNNVLGKSIALLVVADRNVYANPEKDNMGEVIYVRHEDATDDTYSDFKKNDSVTIDVSKIDVRCSAFEKQGKLIAYVSGLSFYGRVNKKSTKSINGKVGE